ncbi:hypothetical protein GUJ93_ZPchr0011g27982 [Zizania palustris]|uniref:Uncharacterized protein n=1 Tax=Zizania palustris TaxID=103762 RepID=A0A8J5WIU3_ZIZPA|nr:hypothetical protein GUJ93_ZPchr0011g27982 [Zizania palustris]
MGSSDGMKELIEKLAAKIDDLKTSLDKLAPLAPVADQLATLLSKVVALQSSAFENQEQVRALNLALLRAENTQREGKAHAKDNGDTTGDGSINRSRQGPVPPPENDRPPPRDRFRQLPPEHERGPYDDEEDAPDSRFHPRVRLEFLSFNGKEDSLPWLNCCETFFRGQSTPERPNYDVALRQPATLDDAIMLARAYEQRMTLESSDPTGSRGERSAGQSSGSAAAAKSTTTGPVAASTSSVTPRFSFEDHGRCVYMDGWNGWNDDDYGDKWTTTVITDGRFQRRYNA